MSINAQFPKWRSRRLRRTNAIRRLVSETQISVNDFVAPLFVREDIKEPQQISSLPGVYQHTLESLKLEVDSLRKLGIPGVILFGIPKSKDEFGSGAWDPDGIVQLALKDLKENFGDDMTLIADLCVDEYTSHGHCGILSPDGTVDNDATLEIYNQIALAQADAGADICAPSGMMDGQVSSIRNALDANSHTQTIILAYSAKYASSLYGPFRDAVDVTIKDGGDRRGYQQDHGNLREALTEIKADISEGADIVMVKPALSFLDVIAKARAEVEVPIAAYHVSGEYSMVKAAEANGWLDGESVMMEHLLSIKRAGADIILTYAAKQAAEIIQD
ncbi:MAG: porphobilinogen synthase [Acidimicrobiales bacterium]|jgi:porphobilinogen synthase|nr:porphobilinogen synthase [Acidimicrobiaceae bacterium]MDP6161333.1 porphobilinogen synthase [Acidimicrobiales bacterium]MDP6285903.1 porphobilinogen synthase [Acidimicrobiales bacterium]HJL91271.1 porphobilinogen synthase [Acidimicrobiales bacterium]HJO41275.1 porphobilinogen synthase [Acidimicrobiales bacterium]